MLFVETFGKLFENESASGAKFNVLSVTAGKDKDGKTQYDSWPVTFAGKAKEAIPAAGSSFKFKGICRNTYSAKTKKTYPSIVVYEIISNEDAPETSEAIEEDNLPFY